MRGDVGVIRWIKLLGLLIWPLLWRHNERDGVSNHRRLDCLLNLFFRHRSKKTSKLRVTGLCEGDSPVTGEFLAQRANNVENGSIWWRHHAIAYSAQESHVHVLYSIIYNIIGYYFTMVCSGVVFRFADIYMLWTKLLLCLFIVIGSPAQCSNTSFTNQGFDSLSGLTSYRLTVKSRSRAIGCYDDRIAVKFGRHLGSAAADVPVKFHCDWKRINIYHAASRLHEITTRGEFSTWVSHQVVSLLMMCQ